MFLCSYLLGDKFGDNKKGVSDLAGVEVAYNFGRLKAITTGGNGAGRIGQIEPATDISFMGQELHRLGEKTSVTLIIDSGSERPRRTLNGYAADGITRGRATREDKEEKKNRN